jgi:hypothetical protein
MADNGVSDRFLGDQSNCQANGIPELSGCNTGSNPVGSDKKSSSYKRYT